MIFIYLLSMHNVILYNNLWQNIPIEEARQGLGMGGPITIRQVTYVYGSKIRGSRENEKAIGFQELPIWIQLQT